MKEFIEKLIGRLEEISVENTCSDCPYKAKCDEVQEHINDETTDLCGATIKALSIEIVNQLAEEHNNGCCEWEKVFDDDIDSEYKPSCSEDGYIEITGYFDYEYCPYCGKKIKVVE